MDYFSRLYNSSLMNNKIKTYIVPSGIPPVHHLLYADDLLLFTSGRKDSVRKLIEIINHFCGVSGQMLNPDKSKNKSLRISVKSEGAKISYFTHLEDATKGKIEGWTKKFLSISGRATLVSSVLAPSVFTLSPLSQSPKTV
ncbi:hypothetical protein QQ045_017308 [Rhodiola kirilowii]